MSTKRVYKIIFFSYADYELTKSQKDFLQSRYGSDIEIFNYHEPKTVEQVIRIYKENFGRELVVLAAEELLMDLYQIGFQVLVPWHRKCDSRHDHSVKSEAFFQGSFYKYVGFYFLKYFLECIPMRRPATFKNSLPRVIHFTSERNPGAINEKIFELFGRVEIATVRQTGVYPPVTVDSALKNTARFELDAVVVTEPKFSFLDKLIKNRQTVLRVVFRDGIPELERVMGVRRLLVLPD